MVRLPRQVSLPLASQIQRYSAFKPALDVRRLTVRVPGLAKELHGFRIAQISDLHVGDGDWGPFRADEVAAVLAPERLDVVVNTGDFVVGRPPLDQVVSISADLMAVADGSGHTPKTLAVPGNHDYYAGEESVAVLRARLEELGYAVLINREVCVERDGSGVSFVGLVPEAPGFEDAVHLLEEVSPPRVALVHEPDMAERFPAHSVDLVLAGHTHGGQIVLPGLQRWAVRHFCGSRYTEGMFHINGNRVYVNRGLGCTGLPIRFRAAPELTIITLAR